MLDVHCLGGQHPAGASFFLNTANRPFDRANSAVGGRFRYWLPGGWARLSDGLATSSGLRIFASTIPRGFGFRAAPTCAKHTIRLTCFLRPSLDW